MTPRLRIENLLAGQTVDRIPFCPAIYEHKAALIGVTPSQLGRSAPLLEQALCREVELYQPDMLVVGCDIYNVEAEAVGCEVRYYESKELPQVMKRVLAPGDDIARLAVPNPERDGRMPVHLDAGSRIHERFGRDRIIRGALSAPFSLACQVVGVDQILPALIDRPSWVGELLAFAASVVKAYGRAFIERGLAVIIFDSYAAPPLVSPELYRKLILPPTAEVVHYFRHSLGVKLVPYIVGGNTQPILEAMLETGTNNLLCDFSSDLEFYVGRLRAEPIILRANLDARFLNSLSVPEIQKKTRETLALGRGHPRFMLGTSILPYDTSPEKVRAIRDVLL